MLYSMMLSHPVHTPPRAYMWNTIRNNKSKQKFSVHLGTLFIYIYICLLNAIRTKQYVLGHANENICSTDIWKQGLKSCFHWSVYHTSSVSVKVTHNGNWEQWPRCRCSCDQCTKQLTTNTNNECQLVYFFYSVKNTKYHKTSRTVMLFSMCFGLNKLMLVDMPPTMQ